MLARRRVDVPLPCVRQPGRAKIRLTLSQGERTLVFRRSKAQTGPVHLCRRGTDFHVSHISDSDRNAIELAGFNEVLP